MPVHLGAESAWRVRHVGDLTLSFQWLDGEPALFLYPRYRRRGAAFVVPLALAHAWAHVDGHPDLSHAIPSAMNAAQALGFSTDRSVIRGIVDAVVDGLPDLLMMPPERPRPPSPAVGEVTLRVNGDLTTEREIPA